MNNKYFQKYGVLFLLILFLPVCWFFYGHAKLFDDNYIYLQYAKHFWENHEISFNVGEISYAFTSPFWQIFYIALFPIIPYQVIPVLLSIIFTLSTIIFCWYTLRDQFEEMHIFIFALLIISFDPILMKHAFNGMETSCAGLLAYVIILGIVLTEKIRGNYFIGLLFGIFMLVRPESGVLAFLTLLYLIGTKQKNFKQCSKIILTTLLVLLPWIIFAYLYFGKILPDTYGAKGGDYPFGNLFFRNLFDSIKVLGGNYLPLFILAILNFRKLIPFIKSKVRLSTYLISVVLVYMVVYSAIISHETFYARYMVLFTPALLLFLVYLYKFSFEARKKFISATISAFILTLFITFIFSRLDKAIVNREHLAESEVTSWVINNTEKDSYICRPRIGEIGFMTQRRIFDPVGLINRDISKYYQSDRIVDYYKMKRPQYFIVSETIISSLKKEASFNLKKKILVTRRYLIRDMLTFNDINKSNIDTLSIYKANWFK